MNALLRGTRDYHIRDYRYCGELGSKLPYYIVTLSTDDYYTIKEEENDLKVIIKNRVMFIGIIDETLQFDLDEGYVKIKIAHYLTKIAYNVDLMKSGASYDITYASSTSDVILADILDGTGFSIGYCPVQTVVNLTGEYLNRLEWLGQLMKYPLYGKDANDNYTTNYSLIASDEQLCDIWTDNNYNVYVGVLGTTRVSSTIETWIEKVVDITSSVLKIPELKESVITYNKVVVLGNGVVIGIAKNGSNEYPAKVIKDNSIKDNTAAANYAKSLLTESNLQRSMTIKIHEDMYLSGVLDLGCWVTLGEPSYIAGTYRIVEIEVVPGEVNITLDRNRKNFIRGVEELKDRVKTNERWG